MSDFELRTIIVQTKGDVSYEIIKVTESASLCRATDGTEQWVSDNILNKFIEEGKGYIKGEKPVKKEDAYIPSKNRLDSID